ncbi:MAG: DNA-directed RNA polymerase subunit omega [bacterium]
MTYVPRHLVTKLIPNKYEAIKVAALEARRLNNQAKALGVSLPGKITTLAIDRLLAGKVRYFDEKERAAQVLEEMEKERELEREKEAEES